MNDPQRAPLVPPYPQPQESIIVDGYAMPPRQSLELAIPMEQPSMYRSKGRSDFELRVYNGVQRALVEYENGKNVSKEAITQASLTVIAFIDGMGS